MTTAATDSALFSPRKKAPLHSRGGSLERGLGAKIKKLGSILTRAGTPEAVFEQGEECSARGRIKWRGGDENIGGEENERPGKTVWD